MEWMELAWLVPLLPLLAAGLIAAFGRLTPGDGSFMGIAATGASLVVSAGIAVHTFRSSPVEALERAIVWAPLGDDFVVELGMLVDGLTAMMFLLVTLVSLMVQIYSREYMHDEVRFTYFFAMLSLFTFSMLFLVIANNTLQAVVGWELVGICSYLLIGFYWEDKPNQDAGNKALLVTRSADVGLIVGVMVLAAGMAGLGESNPFNIGLTIDAAVSGQLATGTIVLGTLLIFLGAVGKSGQMPLHVWLPDAMAGPTPVSALIHAATMVTAGVFLVARLYPLFVQSLAVMHTVAIVGVITLFFAGFLALVQDDIKRVLAYSTISQLGYMMAALGVGGYTAGVFHLFTHGFFKALLFLGSGSLIHAVHSNNMSDMGGLRRQMPHTFWTFIVGSLALAGFPLTAGFFSKDEILVSAQIWGANGFVTGPVVFWLGLAAAAVTTFYMARCCFLVFWGDNRSHHAPHESGKQIVVPLMVLAVLSIAAGYPGSPLWSTERNFEQWTATHILEEATYPFAPAAAGDGEHATGPKAAAPAPAPRGGTAVAGMLAAAGGGANILHGPPTLHVDVLVYTLVALLGAVAVAWWIYGRGRPERDPTFRLGPVTTALVNKYWFDDLGYRYIVVPVRDQLARLTYWTDQAVIDEAVRGVGSLTRHVAGTTYDTLDQKVIDGGVNSAAFSAAWWSDRLRRLQSGNVQRYAGALVAGVIVLVLVFATAA